MKILSAVLALLSLVAPIAQASVPPAMKAGTFDPPRMAPAISLPGTKGDSLTLTAYRGKVVLLGFGFTSCVDVCPVTLATLAQVRRKLGAQGKDVQVIYITVDPARDTAQRLGAYLTAFDPSFVGGTGSDAQLAAVRKHYGIAAERVAGPERGITHSSFIYLIDRQGRLRALMPYGRPAADFVHDVQLLLATP